MLTRELARAVLCVASEVQLTLKLVNQCFCPVQQRENVRNFLYDLYAIFQIVVVCIYKRNKYFARVLKHVTDQSPY